ncbi:MAG: hypothetical protein LBI10_00555 [Deltaproteobacteria bacterium]|jgi:hypothetical protein|nr:hypothetical protein [Deltaproteobacteria bacterium]
MVIHVFYAAELDPYVSRRPSFDRSDFVLAYVGQTWVFKVKMSYDDDGDDSELAKSALSQIKKATFEDFKDPVFLGLVINDKARKITAWESENYVAEANQGQSSEPKPTKAKKTKPAK